MKKDFSENVQKMKKYDVLYCLICVEDNISETSALSGYTKEYSIVWKKIPDFGQIFGIRIRLDSIFCDFWRIFGTIFGAFFGTF